ncbi:DNA helicase/exodeoxyribonuclease V gamma subunit [Pasteurella langaaensis DSM 22999]|uniref:RecBCD enzyme subunit RecC n=1 Tax=Alitibacter langaaensis DSM 22999 TaxID=1122935 RepID=A0A2U0SLZ5_9PAST|nr:exodeoxyribonuclease V subunit gamma [Pasteurella langaaensis]PVX32386.1 DNA helicase/exodeoxyribonuclease V gamma subunit [Pasteurella langaaensis DSM 22999]
MFYIYHSNDLDVQKDILLHLMKKGNHDPFQPETIMVQSPGMAQWLQLQIAQETGIAANLNFPLPASFIWQQYVDNLPQVAQQSQFRKEAMAWRLMSLIPQANVPQLNAYLRSSTQSEQQKRYQLALKIADLFDQYLVYRPDWIAAWERVDDDAIFQQIRTQQAANNEKLLQQIQQAIHWQGDLWRALVAEIQQNFPDRTIQHRANLHNDYLALLKNRSPKNLPARLFVFGISALPKTYLETLVAMAAHCDVHLFFNNPSREYWGDIVDPTFLQKLSLKQRTEWKNPEKFTALLSDTQKNTERTQDNELLQVGHPLLATWGKLGRDFFYLLSQINGQDIQFFTELDGSTLLTQLQNRILNLTPNQQALLNYAENDRTLSFHSCHSPMREVEVLHDYLLQLFQQHPDLTPKDIVVMVADIDRYMPYIQAVFGQYQRHSDLRYIPFSISDGKLSENDVLLATFLSLLRLKESQFSAEDVLALLDIPAVREQFHISLQDLETIRHWVKDAEIRFGLNEQQGEMRNFNAWQAGIERMLLGFAMREENDIWQESLGFDNAYGLKGQLVGLLAAFLARLQQWHQDLQGEHCMEKWQLILTALVDDFFAPNESNFDTLLYIKEAIQQLADLLAEIHFEQAISIDVIAEVMTARLDDNDNSQKFLVGKVNFCTLLPMRAIPFKVVCLLGMNSEDYPRQQTPNSFDLMQYHRQKGDRFRRDDDRYLFLEALLAAQQYLYISYVGRSITDNQAREPSVLVSQLLDYVNENLAQGKLQVQQHSMTIFGPENFSQTHRTFAKEWLPLVNPQRLHIADFATQFEHRATEKIERIEFSQLVQFVRHPVRYFFERQLGVYFRDDETLISDSENFTLEGLDKYNLKGEMLPYEQSELAHFFQRQKLKGIMPRAEFATITEQKVRSEMAPFQEVLQQYISQPPQTEWHELTIPTSQGEILLHGALDQLFGEDKQRVTWRVGSLKDSFRIENWLGYLWQVATTERKQSPVFYTKEKGISAHRFKTVEKSTALELLQMYVESYVQGVHQIQLVPTDNLSCWLKLTPESAVENLAVLSALAQGDGYYSDGDVYWARVFMQTKEWDWQNMLETVKAWFEPMLENA